MLSKVKLGKECTPELAHTFATLAVDAHEKNSGSFKLALSNTHALRPHLRNKAIWPKLIAHLSFGPHFYHIINILIAQSHAYFSPKFQSRVLPGIQIRYDLLYSHPTTNGSSRGRGIIRFAYGMWRLALLLVSH